MPNHSTPALTDAQLAEWAEVAAKATPGEWDIASCQGMCPDWPDADGAEDWQADGRFISIARTALPALLEEVKRLRADGERVDWLAQSAFLEGDVRVTASDGLRAAMDWTWDPFDGGSLRDAIDAARGVK